MTSKTALSRSTQTLAGTAREVAAGHALLPGPLGCQARGRHCAWEALSAAPPEPVERRAGAGHGSVVWKKLLAGEHMSVPPAASGRHLFHEAGEAVAEAF